jgi:hypothetical protein
MRRRNTIFHNPKLSASFPSRHKRTIHMSDKKLLQTILRCTVQNSQNMPYILAVLFIGMEKYKKTYHH